MITYSSKGLAFIKAQEGFHATPTLNYRGQLVIGYGHLAEDDRTSITEEEAHSLLLNDLKMPIKEVIQKIQFVEFYAFFGRREDRKSFDYSWFKSFSKIQNRFDAMLSIRFSCPKKEFSDSVFICSLFNGSPDDVLAHNINRLIYIPDPEHPDVRIPSDYLIARRQLESEYFLKP